MQAATGSSRSGHILPVDPGGVKRPQADPVELDRDRPKAERIEHHRLLALPDLCSQRRDDAFFGERGKRERVVPAKDECIAVVTAPR